MKFSVEILNLQPRHAFRISRGTKSKVENVLLRVEQDAVVGLGEASPNAYYHETSESVSRILNDFAPGLSAINVFSTEDIIALWPQIWPLLAPSRAAICAVDCALWDWLAQSQKISLSELIWGEKAHPVTSCVTLGISHPEELADKISEIAHFPIIKIKVARDNPLALIRHIRKLSSARLIVDANAAWDADTLLTYAPLLLEQGVEMIEQPLPPGSLPVFSTPSPLIFADESCVTPEDIGSLSAGFSGFNIKLVKCGGITPALAMLREGKKRGLQTMVGCMLESSVLISAAAAIAQVTDYADLDGSWLLREEPFHRVHFDRGILTLC